jgi:hypothetical protein
MFVPSFEIPITAQFTGYPDPEYDGEKIYINTSKAYMSATPHTMRSSGWVEFEFELKTSQDKDITACWMFNTSVARPKKPQIYRNYTHENYSYYYGEIYKSNGLRGIQNYQNLGIENYHLYNVDWGTENNTKLFRVNVSVYEEGEWDNNTLVLAFTEWINHGGGNATIIGNCTDRIYEDETFWDWQKLNKDITKKNTNFENNTKSYSIDFTAQTGKRYKVRTWLDINFSGFNTSYGKYWWLIKPQSMSWSEAKSQDRVYCIDPWWNTTWNYRRLLTINNNRSNHQIRLRVGKSVTYHADCNNTCQNNFEDIRFVKYSDNTTELNYWIQNVVASGNNAIFWIDPETESKIWMYWNTTNMSVLTTSDGDATWVEFNDFENTLEDWNDESGNSDVHFVGDAQHGFYAVHLEDDHTGDRAAIRKGGISSLVGSSDYFIQCWRKSLETNRFHYVSTRGTTNTSADGQTSCRFSGNGIMQVRNGGSWLGTGTGYVADIWYMERHYVNLSDGTWDWNTRPSNDVGSYDWENGSNIATSPDEIMNWTHVQSGTGTRTGADGYYDCYAVGNFTHSGVQPSWGTQGSVEEYEPDVEPSYNATIVSVYPPNNSVDLCPCCLPVNLTVTHSNGTGMDILYEHNISGSWTNITYTYWNNVTNGSYAVEICDFIKFDFTYWLRITVYNDDNHSAYNQTTLRYNTTSNINCSGNVSANGNDDPIALDSTQFNIVITMILFFVLYHIGLKVDNRFGGLLLMVSGSILIWLSITLPLTGLYTKSMLTPLAIISIIYGVHKMFYKEKYSDEGD